MVAQQTTLGALTPRWYQLRYHEGQNAFWNCEDPYIVLPCGRRSGKTEKAKRKQIRNALRETKYDDARFAFCAPTRQQAKDIYWNDLKKLVPTRFVDGKPNETELSIRLITGVELFCAGMDRPERIEGPPLNGCVLDEYGNMRSSVWGEHVLPALAERNGYAWFIGAPEGRNHYYDLTQKALVTPGWSVFQWSAETILSAEQIAQMRANLDPLVFDQEVRGLFVEFRGAAYYAFSREGHTVREFKYDPTIPLLICLDFNVSPGVAALAQYTGYGACFFDEVWIKQHSNTPMVMNVLAQRYKDHKGPVIFFGDATGGAKKTSSTEGSDWDLVQKHARSIWPGRWTMRVPRENPSERGRVNSVNSAFSANRITVKGSCEKIIQDLEGVRTVEGGDGSLEKTKDKTLTHLTDAMGYMIYGEFPLITRETGSIAVVV